MCLSFPQKIKQKGDVTCYKVLLVEPSLEGFKNLRSPLFTEQGWVPYRTYTVTKAASPELLNGEIYGRAFHSFKTIEDCVKSDCCPYPYRGRRRIYEAVIPATSKFLYYGNVFYSFSGKPAQGYASQQLYITREVSEDEIKKALENE